ncbi:hypothetical protein B0T16DRAFT_396745 [Cercophora newfieldiana]|uniref:Uncharacterized protein n=1 Tax=Cercophora newfieldiana TaxID=92897 RepID=A0AA40CZV4_9PEZI|nr:hypothetical protein B0T16DRAFT_396745 [Cercophora newfieldiana]
MSAAGIPASFFFSGQPVWTAALPPKSNLTQVKPSQTKPNLLRERWRGKTAALLPKSNLTQVKPSQTEPNLLRERSRGKTAALLPKSILTQVIIFH